MTLTELEHWAVVRRSRKAGRPARVLRGRDGHLEDDLARPPRARAAAGSTARAGGVRPRACASELRSQRPDRASDGRLRRSQRAHRAARRPGDRRAARSSPRSSSRAASTWPAAHQVRPRRRPERRQRGAQTLTELHRGGTEARSSYAEETARLVRSAGVARLRCWSRTLTNKLFSASNLRASVPPWCGFQNSRLSEQAGAVAQDERLAVAEAVEARPAVLREERRALQAEVDVALVRDAGAEGVERNREADRRRVPRARARAAPAAFRRRGLRDLAAAARRPTAPRRGPPARTG